MYAILNPCEQLLEKNRQLPTNKRKIEDLRGARNVVSLGPAGAGGSYKRKSDRSSFLWAPSSACLGHGGGTGPRL